MACGFSGDLVLLHGQMEGHPKMTLSITTRKTPLKQGGPITLTHQEFKSESTQIRNQTVIVKRKKKVDSNAILKTDMKVTTPVYSTPTSSCVDCVIFYVNLLRGDMLKHSVPCM